MSKSCQQCSFCPEFMKIHSQNLLLASQSKSLLPSTSSQCCHLFTDWVCLGIPKIAFWDNLSYLTVIQRCLINQTVTNDRALYDFQVLLVDRGQRYQVLPQLSIYTKYTVSNMQGGRSSIYINSYERCNTLGQSC